MNYEITKSIKRFQNESRQQFDFLNQLSIGHTISICKQEVQINILAQQQTVCTVARSAGDIMVMRD